MKPIHGVVASLMVLATTAAVAAPPRAPAPPPPPSHWTSTIIAPAQPNTRAGATSEATHGSQWRSWSTSAWHSSATARATPTPRPQLHCVLVALPQTPPPPAAPIGKPEFPNHLDVADVPATPTPSPVPHVYLAQVATGYGSNYLTQCR